MQSCRAVIIRFRGIVRSTVIGNVKLIDGEQLRKYQLRQMSPDRLQEISLAWETEAGEDEFAIELAETFSWCKTHLMHRPGDGHAVELCHTESGEAHAILEIVDSPRVALTKLLKVWVAPTYWRLDGSNESVQALSEVFAGAYSGLIESGIDKGFEDVKIYGRTNFMYEILTYLSDNWDEHDEETSAKMEGRWLRVSLKKVSKS